MSSRQHACRQPQGTQCRSHQWVGCTHCGLAGRAVAYPQRRAPLGKSRALAAVRLRICSQTLGCSPCRTSVAHLRSHTHMPLICLDARVDASIYRARACDRHPAATHVHADGRPTSSTLMPGNMSCRARQSTNGMPSELDCASVSLYKMAPVDAPLSPSKPTRSS